MSENKSNQIDGLSEIPQSQRKSWFSIALIWGGAMICVPSLMVGGSLVSGLTFWQAILAGIVGYSIVVAFMTFQGMQGADLGRPTVVSASSTFGTLGSRVVISFILGVALIGWFGVQCGVTGAAFSALLGQMGVTFPVWLASLMWGIIMLSTAIVGYKALAYLNYIAVPAMIFIVIYGVISAINSYGMTGIISAEPAAPFSFFQGIALAVGTFAVGAVIAADYSRYAKNRKGSALSSILGVWPLGVLMVVAGAIMSAIASTADISTVLSGLGLPMVGLIVLILATWTTNTVNAYSGGFAITNMFNLGDKKRALATAAAGILGTVLAVVGILNNFIPFLMILTAGITPIAGVMIADYWVRKKGNKANWAPVKGIRWHAIVAWLLGGIVGYFVKWGLTAINGLIVAFVVYLILDVIFEGKK